MKQSLSILVQCSFGRALKIVKRDLVVIPTIVGVIVYKAGAWPRITSALHRCDNAIGVFVVVVSSPHCKAATACAIDCRVALKPH